MGSVTVSGGCLRIPSTSCGSTVTVDAAVATGCEATSLVVSGGMDPAVETCGLPNACCDDDPRAILSGQPIAAARGDLRAAATCCCCWGVSCEVAGVLCAADVDAL